MTWPGTLSAEEQEIVQTFVDQLYRPAMIRLVQAMNITDGAKEEFTQRVQAILAGLVDADVIPNTSGYAGAEALTKAELVTALGNLNTMLTTYNATSARNVYRKAVGTRNMLSE